MAILNKYYTTWISDDSQLYKLEIIPSHSQTDTSDTHTSGFVETQLPDDFLLKDMKLELDLGDIPIGLMNSTLKMQFNIGADGTEVANYSTLRNKLLRGSDASNYPFTDTWVASDLFGYFVYQSFNTFILSYSDDDGASWNVIFIGCQKFAADNEIELTKLSPVITLSIEAYDITRCIGEMIRPETWFAYLKCTSDLVNYGDYCTTTVPENKEYHDMDISSHNVYTLLSPAKRYILQDRLTNGLTYKIQTFERLREKIEVMYASHMRSILCTDSYFTLSEFFYKMTKFKSMRTWDAAGVEFLEQHKSVCIVSEINLIDYSDGQNPIIYENAIGGMLKDKEGFGQFSNFHEVLVSLQENFAQKTTITYSYDGTSYNVDLTSDTAVPQTSVIATGYQARQETVFDSIKFKLFNETMNTAKAEISNLKGDSDTTDWSYSIQTTSNDNSKDIKTLFHNYPILTSRNEQPIGALDTNYEYASYYRNTINCGTLCYLHEDGIVRKVNTICKVDWFWDYAEPFTALVNTQPIAQQIIVEQQTSGLQYSLCIAMVQIMGLPTFKTAEFRTTQKNQSVSLKGLRSEKFGGWSLVMYSNLNSILGAWDPSGILARGTVTKYSLDIYSGMADVTLIINGVPT